MANNLIRLTGEEVSARLKSADAKNVFNKLSKLTNSRSYEKNPRKSPGNPHEKKIYLHMNGVGTGDNSREGYGYDTAAFYDSFDEAVIGEFEGLVDTLQKYNRKFAVSFQEGGEEGIPFTYDRRSRQFHAPGEKPEPPGIRLEEDLPAFRKKITLRKRALK